VLYTDTRDSPSQRWKGGTVGTKNIDIDIDIDPNVDTNIDPSIDTNIDPTIDDTSKLTPTPTSTRFRRHCTFDLHVSTCYPAPVRRSPEAGGRGSLLLTNPHLDAWPPRTTPARSLSCQRRGSGDGRSSTGERFDVTTAQAAR